MATIMTIATADEDELSSSSYDDDDPDCFWQLHATLLYP
jgi:hypothetical protein